MRYSFSACNSILPPSYGRDDDDNDDDDDDDDNYDDNDDALYDVLVNNVIY
jgi:hypothetical protein